MTTSTASRPASILVPSGLINGRRVAAILLPNFSFNKPAPLLRLFLDHYEGPADSPLTVKILELDHYYSVDGKRRVHEGGKDVVLAEFQVTPVPAAGLEPRVWWKDPEPKDPAHREPPGRHVPYFRLTFAGPGSRKAQGTQEPDPDCPVFCIPLDAAGEELDGFEIGYRIEDADGHVQARLDCNVAKLVIPHCHVPCAHETALLSADFALRHALEAGLAERMARSTRDRLEGPTLAGIEERKHQEFKQAARLALEQLRTYLETSETAYASHLRHYREYITLLDQYIREVEHFGGTDGDERSRMMERLHRQRDELEKRKRDLDEYLGMNGSIPRSYLEQSKRIREAREKSEALDRFLDHPVIRLITVLPGGSLVTAVTQIAQGKYKEALITAGLDLLSYGSFKKLEVMADLYRSIGSARSRGESVVFLLASRYLSAALTEAGKMDTLLGLAAKGFGKDIDAFFQVYRGFKSLAKNVNGIVHLTRARKALEGGAKAVTLLPDPATPAQVILALKTSGHYHDFLLAADYLRAFRTLGKLEKNAVSAAGHIAGEDFAVMLKRELAAIKSLGRHESLLPSVGTTVLSTQALEGFLQRLGRVSLSPIELMDKIPYADIEARCMEEAAKESPNQWLPRNLANPELHASLDTLVETLEDIKWAFDEIIPTRAAEARSKSLGYFEGWDWKKCRFDFGLEKKIDKLTDQLESRMKLLGFETCLRDWFYGRSLKDRFGKTWIYDIGYSGIGIDRCEIALRQLGAR